MFFSFFKNLYLLTDPLYGLYILVGIATAESVIKTGNEDKRNGLRPTTSLVLAAEHIGCALINCTFILKGFQLSKRKVIVTKFYYSDHTGRSGGFAFTDKNWLIFAFRCEDMWTVSVRKQFNDSFALVESDVIRVRL